MTSECSGGDKFTQLVANHVLGDVDRNMLAAVMDGNRMADEGGENGGSSGATNGTFLTLLLITQFPPYFEFLRLMMNLLVGFFVLRVL